MARVIPVDLSSGGWKPAPQSAHPYVFATLQPPPAGASPRMLGSAPLAIFPTILAVAGRKANSMSGVTVATPEQARHSRLTYFRRIQVQDRNTRGHPTFGSGPGLCDGVLLSQLALHAGS